MPRPFDPFQNLRDFFTVESRTNSGRKAEATLTALTGCVTVKPDP